MCLVNRSGLGLGEARRHADSVDTRSIQVKQVRHEESRRERDSRRLNDETDAEIENRAAHEHHGLRVHENRDKKCQSVNRREHDSVADRCTSREIREVHWWCQSSSAEFVEVQVLYMNKICLGQ